MVSINAESLQISIRTKNVELQVLYMFKKTLKMILKIQKKTFSNRFFPRRYSLSSWQEGLLKSEVFSVSGGCIYIHTPANPLPNHVTTIPLP